jgi:hypothetical protein
LFMTGLSVLCYATAFKGDWRPIRPFGRIPGASIQGRSNP